MRYSLLFVVIFVACNTQVKTPSIEGSWFFIQNDTTYGEVFFTEDHLWTYDEGAGEVYLKYKITGDTIIFYNWTGGPGILSKYTYVSKSEFILDRIGANVKSRFHQLNVKMDTAQLLKGDETTLDNYIREFRHRRYRWMKGK